MKKKITTIILFTILCAVGCADVSHSENDSQNDGPKKTLVVESTKQSFVIGDYLSLDDFTVEDVNGNPVSNAIIEDYDLFKQGPQIVKFYDTSGDNYGTFELTLSPRKNGLKVLFLANSHADDTLTYSYKQVSSLDVNLDEVHFVNNYKGGHDLQGYGNEGINEIEVYTYNDFNLDNPYADANRRAMKYAIEKDSWDFIVLQQYTQEYHLNAQFGYISQICEYAKEHCSNKNVKFLFNMTFAYPDGASLSIFQSKYEGKSDVLYSKIVEQCQEKVLTNQYIDAVIPMGTAIKNAQTSSLTTDKLFRDDGIDMYYEHLSLDYGRFIAGMAFVSFITGYSADQITYTNNYPESFINIAKTSVKNAIAHPFEVTPF